MAHTATGGSTRLGRDSQSKRLGVKLYDGQIAQAGNVLVRQRGTKFIAGKNTKLGSDDTIYAVKSGKVKFTTQGKKSFTGKTRKAKVINVL